MFALGTVGYVQSGRNAATSTFTGLDVVILIDQSGSMWGYQKSHPQRNDQYDHRIGQTKNIIYRLAEHVENTPFVHRVSVIDFGDDATVAISNHQMRYNPADPGGALRDTKSIVEGNVTAKLWVNTNTPAAMALGLKELEKMASSPPNNGRTQVILIITDGRANLPGKKNETQLKDEIRAYAKDSKNKDVGVWIVGINDADNYWREGDGSFWESVTEPKRARLADTATSDIFTIVQDIVDEWLGAKSTPVLGNEYECPPYMQRIIFNVNFSKPRTPINIKDPDGNPIPVSAGGSSSAPGTNARFEVANPKPGIYKIERDPSFSYHVMVEEYSPNIKRLSPARAANLNSEAKILFQATDSKGTPLDMLSNWPINASVVITSPSGVTSPPIPATFQGDGKFTARWKPSELGVHKMRLRGLVTLKNGSSFDVFNANAHSYDDQLAVNQLHPYWLQFDNPNPASTLRVWSTDTSEKLQLSLVDEKGQKVTGFAGLVKDPATWLSIQLIDGSGVPVSGNAVPLVPDASGSFQAEVPVRLDWKTGEGWWMPGHLGFRVIAQPDHMTGDNFLDSIQLPPEAEDKRIASDPMTVGPIDVKFSLIFFGLGLLIFLGLLLSGVWYLLMRLLPGMLIWRADSSHNRTVELKIFNGADDPNGDYAKKYPAGTWGRFKYDRQISLSIDGQDYIAKKFRVVRVPSPEQIMAQVNYCWQNEPDKEYTVLLNKGKAERLKGLPGGEFLLALESK
jgi:hypothetical protein